jgi:hypothetical protein
MTRIALFAATALAAGGLGMAGLALAAGAAQADPVNDHCSTRSGCYKGPGMRWCPGDYVWPGLVATGWDLTVCHVYHEQCPPGEVACPDFIAEGPPPPTPPALISTREQCEAILGFFCPVA